MLDSSHLLSGSSANCLLKSWSYEIQASGSLEFTGECYEGLVFDILNCPGRLGCCHYWEGPIPGFHPGTKVCDNALWGFLG